MREISHRKLSIDNNKKKKTVIESTQCRNIAVRCLETEQYRRISHRYKTEE